MSLKSIDLKLVEKFQNQEYFHEFFGGRAQDEVAAQIRDLREKNGLTQGALADKCEMKQSAISRLEDSQYAGWTFNTLRRVAAALDAKLTISFMPRKEVITQYEKMNLAERHFKVPERRTIPRTEETKMYSSGVVTSENFVGKK